MATACMVHGGAPDLADGLKRVLAEQLIHVDRGGDPFRGAPDQVADVLDQGAGVIDKDLGHEVPEPADAELVRGRFPLHPPRLAVRVEDPLNDESCMGVRMRAIGENSTAWACAAGINRKGGAGGGGMGRGHAPLRPKKTKKTAHPRIAHPAHCS